MKKIFLSLLFIILPITASEIENCPKFKLGTWDLTVESFDKKNNALPVIKCASKITKDYPNNHLILSGKVNSTEFNHIYKLKISLDQNDDKSYNLYKNEEDKIVGKIYIKDKNTVITINTSNNEKRVSKIVPNQSGMIIKETTTTYDNQNKILNTEKAIYKFIK